MGKKFRPPMNKGKIEKDFLNRIALDKNKQKFLMTNFEDREFTFKKNSLHFHVLKMLVYALSHDNREYAVGRYNQALDEYAKIDLFFSRKMHNAFTKCDLTVAKAELSKDTKSKFKELWKEQNDIFFVTILILYKYFNFQEYIKEKKDYIEYIQDLSFYALVLAMEHLAWTSKIEYEKKSDIDVEYVNGYLAYFNKEKADNKTYKFDEKSLNCTFADEASKKEFACILNQYIDKWYNGTEEEKANAYIDFDFNDNDVSVAKWDSIKSMLAYEDCVFELDVKSLGEFGEYLVRITDINFALFYSHYTNFIDGILEGYGSGYFKMYAKEVNEKSQKTDNEIRVLNATNKQITKSVSKLESDNSKLVAENESLKKQLEEAKKIEEDSEELKQLREEREKYSAEKAELHENLVKAENKVDWQEKKIEELTQKLDFYSTLEEDLMSVQNENQSLISSIERIESLEAEDNEKYEQKYNAIKDLPMLFVGGKNNMLQKLKKYFPNSDFIDIDDGYNFNTSGKYEYAIVFTRVVSHAQCARLSSQMPKEKIFNINTCNVTLIVDELYRLLKN